MLDKGHKDNCEFTGEIVPYLYAELGPDERDRFESHLADCMICTDEFAGISHSRFSVLEWQRGEFAELPTPRIVIPYETATVSVGWLAGLRDLVTLSGWSSAAAVAAILIAVIGAGYLVLNNSGQAIDIVSVPPVSVADQSNMASVKVTTTKPTAISDPSSPSVLEPVKAKRVERRVQNLRPLVAGAAKPRGSTPSRLDEAVQGKPALSTFDEDDDKSLRLADLFDDGGV